MALETLSLEEVKLFDTGQYYVLEWLDPEEEDGRKECVAIVVMKRSNGLLLAIPTGFLPEEVLAAGAEHEDSMVGRSSVITVAGVLLEEGVVSPIGAQLQTLVVDMDVAVLVHLREMEDVEPIMQGFSEDDPYAVPSRDELLAKALAWLESLDGLGERLGPLWYTPAQTEESTEEAKVSQGGLPKQRPKAAPRGGGIPRRAKREGKEAYNGFSVSVTPGGVAGPADPDQSASVSIPEAAEYGGQTGEAEQCGLDVVSTFGRSGFSSKPSRLGKGDSQVIRVKAAAPLLPATLATAPVDVKELEEIRTDQTLGGDVAKAMLAQSAALTSLVAHLAAGQADPMQELQGGASSGTRGALGRVRLQAELASQKGLFFHAVVMQMARRMAPTSSADQPYGVLMFQGISGVKYLERFGGYGRQRELGVVMHQVMVAFDFLLTDNVEGAKDAVALLAVMLEQAALDQGRFDLAQLLTLQEDVPASIFTARNVSSLSRSRSFAPLADQKWVTCALAYLRELETISSKRSELASSSTSGGGDGQPKGGGLGKTGSPKKKGRGAGRGRNQDAEEEQQ